MTKTGGKIYCVLGLEESILLNSPYYPRQSRFNAIPIKLPVAFFYRTRRKNFKIYMETQKNPNSQSNLEKEEQSWRNQAP